MLPEIIASIAILIASVILHEIAHGYAALAQGDGTAKRLGRLTLNPLAHVDPIGSILVPLALFSLGGVVFGWAKPVPYDPRNLRDQRWGPALVAIAGPAVNLFIALIFGLGVRMGGSAGLISPAALQLLLAVVLLNISLAVFNLIPIAPLDGSKILFALIPPRYYRLERWLERHQLILFIGLLIIIANTHWLDWAVFSLFSLLTGAGL